MPDPILPHSQRVVGDPALDRFQRRLSEADWRGDPSHVHAAPDDLIAAVARIEAATVAQVAAGGIGDYPWVKVGETMIFDPFWYDDLAEWRLWTTLVVNEVDQRGAWFIVGITTDVDRIVIDVLDAYSADSRLHELLRARNVRSVEFWRGKS